MDPNGSQMTPNGPKWIPNDPKWAQVTSKWLQMITDDSGRLASDTKWFPMAPGGSQVPPSGTEWLGMAAKPFGAIWSPGSQTGIGDSAPGRLTTLCQGMEMHDRASKGFGVPMIEKPYL